MGFLEDIGRSDTLFREGQSLSRGANELARIQMQGPEKQFENIMALKRMQLLQGEENRRNAEFNMNVAEHQRQVEKETRFLPLSLFGVDQNNMTEPQKKMFDDLTKAKFLYQKNGVWGLDQNNAPFVKEYYHKYPERLKDASIALYQDLNNKLLKAQQSGKTEDVQQLTKQMTETESQINQLNKMINYKENQSTSKGYGTTNTAGGVMSYNKDTGLPGTRLGGLPPQESTNPVVIDQRNKRIFTQEYTARKDSIKAQITNVFREYNLTRTEAMRVAEGDTSILTERMTPQQIAGLKAKLADINAQLGNLDDQYNTALERGVYEWGQVNPKEEVKPQGNKKLVYDPDTGTFK